MDSSSSLIDLQSKNYSFFAVPIAVLLTIIPEVIGKSFAPKLYDPANPRTYLERVDKDEKIDKVIHRSYAASSNSLESLPLFATGVIAASYSGLAHQTVNLLSLGFLVSRVLFIWTYIWLSVDRRFAPLRSLLWVGSTVCWLGLWVGAGLEMVN